jgi:hypothetical protein
MVVCGAPAVCRLDRAARTFMTLTNRVAAVSLLRNARDCG